MFGDVLCKHLGSSTRTSNCDGTARERADGGYLCSFPLTSSCETGYSNSSDCGYCRKTRSGQSDVKRESLLDPIHMNERASQALGDSHDASSHHALRSSLSLRPCCWLVSRCRSIPMLHRVKGTLCSDSYLTSRIFILCIRILFDPGILRSTHQSLLETLGNPAVSAKPEERVLSALHPPPGLGSVQTVPGPASSCEPVQSLRHWR